MKKKIGILILIILFIIALIGINVLLNSKNEKYAESVSDSNQNMAKEENDSVQNTTDIDNDLNQSIVNEDEGNTIISGNAVTEVNEDNFEQEVLQSEKTVLIDFYADWCNPCKILSPIVEEVAEENDNIKVVKVNVDNSENLAMEYGVYSIPTLVVIKDGKEINRSIGVISKEEVLKLVNN